MDNERVESRAYRFQCFLLIALPVASLVLNAIAWLRHGVDIPFYDDWRGYNAGTIDSFSFSYLLTSANDTFSPVGIFLDALAQRHLDGNSVAYQFLSMVVVLGGLLYFQWKLLRWALMDRLAAAACFVFTLLMLQPGSYWGIENLAYQQALPLLFGMAALNLLFVWDGRDRWRLPGLFLLGVLAGASYISGAIAILVMGVALLAMGFFSSAGMRLRLLRGGGVLLVAGLATSVFQLSLFLAQGFRHHAGGPLVLPGNADFWLFVFGKIAHSLALSVKTPELSLLIVCVVVAIVAALSIYYLWRHFRHAASDERNERIGIVFIVLGAVVLSYLFIIAAGRTSLRPPQVSAALDIFVHGFYRFHHFWVTLFWPWLIAGLIGWFGGREFVRKNARIFAVLSAILLAVSVDLMIRGDVLKHSKAYRSEMALRRSSVSCLLHQVQRGESIYCAGLGPWDASAGYAYARTIGASFVRYSPILPVPFGSDEPAPLFRFSRDRSRVETANFTEDGQKQGRYVATNYDSLLIFSSGQPDKMARCSLLNVSVLLRVPSNDRAQLFYRPLGQAAYSESYSLFSGVEASMEGYKRLDFWVENLEGFEDGFRFDPVTQQQPVEIGEIEVRCRIAGARVAVARQ